jgi:hypothetical protein
LKIFRLLDYKIGRVQEPVTLFQLNEISLEYSSGYNDTEYTYMVKTEIGFKLGKKNSSGLVHIIGGTVSNYMSQELIKLVVQLWRYGQNTDFLTPSPYLNIIDLQ